MLRRSRRRDFGAGFGEPVDGGVFAFGDEDAFGLGVLASTSHVYLGMRQRKTGRVGGKTDRGPRGWGG